MRKGEVAQARSGTCGLSASSQMWHICCNGEKGFCLDRREAPRGVCW